MSEKVQETLAVLRDIGPGGTVLVIGPPKSGKTTLALLVASGWQGRVVSLQEALTGHYSGPMPSADPLLIADGIHELERDRLDTVVKTLGRVRNSKKLLTSQIQFPFQATGLVTVELDGRPLGRPPDVAFKELWASSVGALSAEHLLSGDLGLELLLAPPDCGRLSLVERSSLLGPDGNPLSDDSQLARAHFANVREVSGELLEWLAAQPDRLRHLDPRRFEEVVAELLVRRGYEVHLTPAKRDGGRDIQAARHADLGQFLYFVECKQWTKPVHVDVVRRLHGVVEAEGATAGVVATTSRFTKGAREFQEKVRWKMSLRDLAALGDWLAVAPDATPFDL